ncbi:MAG: DEAD/DEAH box helicase [Burkholderiales bacterium]|nr:DEAD/DEAH box helicase [Burkholderiales bacterium]
MLFTDLGLCPALLNAVTSNGFTAPTAVQSAAIPPAIAGQDVLAKAQTGSGKTFAFALPLLQTLTQTNSARTRFPRALVLVPTRELAVQVGEALHLLSKTMPESIKVSVVFGGVSINPQMMALRGGTDIVVATTGRLLDLLDRNALTLSSVSMLVLDEADRMLDLGFSEELQRILALLPAKRQNLFFSATYPAGVEALANTILQNPARVDVLQKAIGQPDITQRAIAVDAARRTQLLRHLITTETWPRVLVFVATKHAAEIVADKLRRVHIDAEPFHGELSQGKRTQVLHDFKASRIRVVVATDMAARGLDITQLPAVVNFDLPRSSADYTHRIGRTGRAGEAGIAISFVSAVTEPHFQLIERRQGHAVPREVIAGFERTEAAPVSADSAHGGIKGKRPSKKDKLRAAQAAQTDPSSA